MIEDTSKIPLDRVIELPDELKSIKEAINTLLKPGDICYSLRTEKEGWLLMDGREVSRTEYADLFDVIGTAYGMGDGSTTFNLPNCSGKFLQMDTSKTVGTNIEAGLPNITGGYSNTSRLELYPNDTVNLYGAFAKGNSCKNTVSTANNYTGYGWTFDASRCSSIYGKSTTVQPPAIVVNYFIKY